jgi:hypothetical protein
MPVVRDPFSQSRILQGLQVIAMKQSEQKNRRRLTGLYVDLTLAIPGRGHDGLASERENFSRLFSSDFRIHSRDVYVLLFQQHRAGVFHGIGSEANSGSRPPTRHEARWVFAFPGDSLIPENFERCETAR